MRHLAIVPDVIKHSAAPVRAGEGASSISRPHISCERCGAVPSCRMGSSTVRPRCVRGEGPAASAGLTSLTSEAAPCRRPGCDQVLCRTSACGERGQQRPQALHSLRAMRRHAIVPSAIVFRCRHPCVRCGPAAPTGLASLANGVPPNHRTRCDRLLCGSRSTSRPYVFMSGAAPCYRARRDRLQRSDLLRMLRRRTIVLNVIAYSAAIGPCDISRRCQQAGRSALSHAAKGGRGAQATGPRPHR